MEVSKSDWKLFRSSIAEWQESYMERLVKEYIDMLNGTGNASDKFWSLINSGVITKDDLVGFSNDLKEKLDFYLGREG